MPDVTAPPVLVGSRCAAQVGGAPALL